MYSLEIVLSYRKIELFTLNSSKVLLVKPDHMSGGMRSRSEPVALRCHQGPQTLARVPFLMLCGLQWVPLVSMVTFRLFCLHLPMGTSSKRGMLCGQRANHCIRKAALPLKHASGFCLCTICWNPVLWACPADESHETGVFNGACSYPPPKKWILERYHRFGSPEETFRVSCESELLEFPGKTNRGMKKWARSMTTQQGFSITLSPKRRCTDMRIGP